jgi:hypothetical protein
MNKTELNILRQLLAKFRQNVDNKSSSIVLPASLVHDDALGAVEDTESIVKETMRQKHNWKFRDDLEG